MNVLFDRETLKVVGASRSPLPFELEIKNVDTTNLYKNAIYTELEDKFSEEGKQLYILPQNPIVEEIGKEIEVETTENTGNPVMVLVNKQVPLLDENSKQMQYEVTQDVIIPAVFDEETGEVIEEERIEQKPTGRFIKCFTMDEVEEHKTNEYGQKLFYDKTVVLETVYTPQPDLEITEDDERFVEGLEKAKVLVEKSRYVTFNESPNEFTYAEVTAHKEKTIQNGTFFGEGKLFEQFSDEMFSTNLAGFRADIGFDYFSLPSGGEARTVKLELPSESDTVAIKLETSLEGLVVSIGDTASNLVKTDSYEVTFESNVSEVYVKFENPTDKRIDVYSFALLV